MVYAKIHLCICRIRVPTLTLNYPPPPAPTTIIPKVRTQYYFDPNIFCHKKQYNLLTERVIFKKKIKKIHTPVAVTSQPVRTYLQSLSDYTSFFLRYCAVLCTFVSSTFMGLNLSFYA